MRWRWLVSLLIAAQALAVAQDFAIRNAKIFDGERVIPRGSVLVLKGTIGSVGSHVHIPSNVRAIDAKGKTLIPGLIDAHTHIHSRRELEQSAVFGVTTDISMLMDLQLMKSLKAEQSVGKAAERADLVSSGYAATAPGGHSTEYGLKFPTLSGPDNAQPWVDGRIAEGSDFIKIIYVWRRHH